MKKISIVLLFALLIVNGYALSDHSRISILTCGPGKNLYSSFGHTALRVVDKYNDLDIVFNYGAFDPSQDHFYRKFINGTLMYSLSTSDYNRFYEDYAKEGRAVTEQILNLSIHEKNSIWDKLRYDHLEENRHYRYDFVHNNCTTKISDIVNLVNPIYAYRTPDSFRSLINSVLSEKRALKFLLNLLMGNKADALLESNERNCLPDIFMNSLNNAQIMSSGETKPLVIEKRVVLQGTTPTVSPGFDVLFFSVLIFIVICDLILLFRNYPFWIKYTKWMMSPILLMIGLTGSLILFLGIVNFQLAAPNINILWCSPLNFLLLPLLFLKHAKFQEYLLLINLSGCLVSVILLLSGLQETESQCIILLVLLIIVYCIFLYGNSTQLKIQK